MKILLTFIGNNDCHLDENRKGAIISVLEETSIDKLYIFYNNEKYLKFASQILIYSRDNFPKLDVNYVESLSADPTDYNTVYPAMYKSIRRIIKENAKNNPEYTISITSGTPTMHACWIFLQKGGIIDAELIQTSREKGISKINLLLDDFPQIQNVDEIKAEMTKLARENKNFKKQLNLQHDGIIGECLQIIKVKQKIQNLAEYDIPVFISGESGTGKELVAEAIHFNSSRKEQTFVKVNCGAISPNLFESEFFGHKKGSFTGADTDKEGKFKQADNGSIFLDEICDLPLNMQVKLLRVLQDETIQPVGGNEEKVNVRIISASNTNIIKLVNESKFRKDLYYRIYQGKISLPPLRDRGNDKILLAEYHISKLNQRYKKQKRLAKSALHFINNYKWAGNIRELFSVLETAFIHSENEIKKSDLELIELNSSDHKIFIPEEGLDFDNEIPKAYYQAALQKTDGNQAEAARLLKIQPHTFRERLKKLT
ncbi:MAG: sigma-54 dependent transcriptional regulator [Candidatus Cloacimonadota bacterium]|nr:sigma-54 dependent transcriptional regulator [Candidatus Cloacimonadota bacterium]